MSLHLLHCLPDARRLALWGERHGLLHIRRETGYQQDDSGYALHALLKAAFGPLAPKPFWYRSAREGLLAFTTHDPEALRQNATLASPEITEVLGLHSGKRDLGLLRKPYPILWQPGHRLGFESRVRPVLRENQGAERDVFQVQAERQAADAAPLTRAAVYTEWLSQQMARNEAAVLLTTDLKQFRLTSVLRQQARDADGTRTRGLVTGPEVVLTGQLQVKDAEAFAALLTRGVGRHRAFGFGLLLLRPAA